MTTKAKPSIIFDHLISVAPCILISGVGWPGGGGGGGGGSFKG